tara:strand:- start:1238 stop:1540 length:303 start_codon:yes stop_codon:yes gene_type:complete
MEAIKQELGEELEKEEENHLEYDKDKMIKEVDDSWIRVEDREKLIHYLKEVTALEFSWAENTLLECMVLKKYYNIIENMDRKQYELDCKNPLTSVLSILS